MKNINTIITTITVLIVLVVANFLASRHPLRLDLTKNGMFTLSSATKNVLKDLDDVVTIRAYFTRDLPPAMQPLRRDVDDILAEFKSAAGNRLQVEFVDPASSPMEEQKVMLIGIPPIQLNVVEKDKQEVAKIYLGMVVMFGDKKQVLPVVKDLDNLEYELTEAIIRVSVKELPKVAWSMPEGLDEAKGAGFNVIREAVSKLYDIVNITDKNITELDPKKYPAFVLISPVKFSAEWLFAVDQYLMNGGNIIALIDRYNIGQGLVLTPLETNASELITHYGISVEDSLVLDKSNAMASFSGGLVTYHMPYPFWPEVRRGQFSSKSPIVSGLESAVLPWTSPLTVGSSDDGKDDEPETILAKTTSYGTAVSGKDAKLDPQSAGEEMLSGKHEVKPLIAKKSGPFSSYYSAAEKAGEVKGKDIIKESPKDAKLLVVGSSHWIADRTLQMFPQNAVLFENALDSFAMGDKLIGIRSRANESHPIGVLSDGIRLALKYINIFIGPVAVIVLGLVLFAFRRARRRFIQAAYR